jgi:hypothetical protein
MNDFLFYDRVESVVLDAVTEGLGRIECEIFEKYAKKFENCREKIQKLTQEGKWSDAIRLAIDHPDGPEYILSVIPEDYEEFLNHKFNVNEDPELSLDFCQKIYKFGQFELIAEIILNLNYFNKKLQSIEKLTNFKIVVSGHPELENIIQSTINILA